MRTLCMHPQAQPVARRFSSWQWRSGCPVSSVAAGVRQLCSRWLCTSTPCVAHAGPSQPAVLRPFPGAQLKQLPQFEGSHADQLLWGTYRPGYYFGTWSRALMAEPPPANPAPSWLWLQACARGIPPP